MSVHEHWLNSNRVLIASAAFAAYATALAVYTGGADQVWAIWAAVAYGATTAVLLLARMIRRWIVIPPLAPLLISLGGALAGPLIWLSTKVSPTPEVQVISRSATQLLKHGTPYLPTSQMDSWLSYNPYLPLMAVFGMPRAMGATGLFGDPRLWMAVVSLVLLAIAFWLASPHLTCRSCSRHVLLATVFAASSPVIAFPLSVGITDPPVIALLLVTLALAARPGRRSMWAGVVLGVASAMKSTAWPAIPVIAALMATRDGIKAMWRFVGVAFLLAVALAAAMAPAALSDPTSFLQNTVLFPLGLTEHRTPAASPLPGHLLAMTGSAGHAAAVGLLLAAGLGFALSLIVRPPADARGAAFRLALGLAVMFTLAPATRWGYFVYPIGLVGWIAITDRGPIRMRRLNPALAGGVPTGAIPAAAMPGAGLSVPSGSSGSPSPAPELAAARLKKLMPPGHGQPAARGGGTTRLGSR